MSWLNYELLKKELDDLKPRETQNLYTFLYIVSNRSNQLNIIIVTFNMKGIKYTGDYPYLNYGPHVSSIIN